MATGRTRDELELSDYLAVLRRRWRWLLLPIVLCGAAAALLTLSQAPRYEATARVLLEYSAAQDAVAGRLNVETGLDERDIINEINLAESDATSNRVRDVLGLEPGAELPEGSIKGETDSDLLVFTFSADDPERAALVSNTWADAYVDLKQSEAQVSIDGAVETLEARLVTLREERAELRADLDRLEDRLAAASEEEAPALQSQVDREERAIAGDLSLIDAQIQNLSDSITEVQLSNELAGSARVVQSAEVPDSSSNAPLSRNLVLALLLGAVLGVGAALLADNLDKSIRGTDDVTRLGLTVLGSIPVAPRGLAGADLATVAQLLPGSHLADGYQKVRTALEFVTIERDVRTILVTSPSEGEGKTTTAVNLALAFANSNKRVVLADIDFRRPRVHEIFNTSLVPGISESLSGDVSLQEISVSHPGLSSTLLAMPAGAQPPNPAAFLSSPVAALLGELRMQADLTILDAPPVLPVADALAIAPHAEGVVLVVRLGKTTREELARTVEGITRSGGTILGVVLNRSRERTKNYGYGKPATRPGSAGAPARVATPAPSAQAPSAPAAEEPLPGDTLSPSQAAAVTADVTAIVAAAHRIAGGTADNGEADATADPTGGGPEPRHLPDINDILFVDEHAGRPGPPHPGGPATDSGQNGAAIVGDNGASPGPAPKNVPATPGTEGNTGSTAAAGNTANGADRAPAPTHPPHPAESATTGGPSATGPEPGTPEEVGTEAREQRTDNGNSPQGPAAAETVAHVVDADDTVVAGNGTPAPKHEPPRPAVTELLKHLDELDDEDESTDRII